MKCLKYLILPCSQTVQQLLAGTQLLHQQHIQRGDESSIQLNQVGVVQPPEQLVLLQHQLSLLGLVGSDLSSKYLTGFHIPAQVYDTETTPERKQEV